MHLQFSPSKLTFDNIHLPYSQLTLFEERAPRVSLISSYPDLFPS